MCACVCLFVCLFVLTDMTFHLVQLTSKLSMNISLFPSFSTASIDIPREDQKVLVPIFEPVKPGK